MEPQQRFFDACETHKYVYGIAGIGGGKSISGAYRLTMYAITGSNTRWAFVAPTFGDATAILDFTLLELVPDGTVERVNRQLHEIKLKNNSVIFYRSADAVQRLRALGSIDGAWLDEAEDFRPDIFKIMQGRVARGGGNIWVTTSPRKWTGPEANKRLSWIFKELSGAGITIEPDTMFYEAGNIAVVSWKSADNPWFDEEEIAILREQYGPLWAAQELDGLYVDLYAGDIFKEEYFKAADLDAAWEYVVIAFDPAISKSGLADYSVAQVWALFKGNAYLLEEIRGRPDPVEQLEMLRALVDKWKAHKIIVEDVAYQRAIITHLKKEGFPVEGVRPDGNKTARASRLSGPMAACKVYFKPEILTDDFVSEFVQFPNWPHDDRVDCAGYGVQEVLHGDGEAKLYAFTKGWA